MAGSLEAQLMVHPLLPVTGKSRFWVTTWGEVALDIADLQSLFGGCDGLGVGHLRFHGHDEVVCVAGGAE
jgi:hypothetical protein